MLMSLNEASHCEVLGQHEGVIDDKLRTKGRDRWWPLQDFARL